AGGENGDPKEDGVRRLITTMAAVAALGAPLGAQRAHQFEIGAFGSYTRYDRAFQLENQVGFGGRLGYFFGNIVGIEVDAGSQRPGQTSGADADLLHGSASLTLNFAAGERHLFYLLGGYSRLDFEPRAPFRFTDNAVHGAVGDRVFLGSRAALRAEVRAIYAPSTRAPFGASWAGHIVGSLGLSLFAGGGPVVDTDRDGIADRRDACPATPAGAVVDPQGCPADSDGDQVFNGLDACPNTPAGVTVDRTGCPVDSDRDGVADGPDQCPGTPAGAQVDGQGCPLDEDGDSVPDGPDACPATPRGAQVDARGCPLDADGDRVYDGLDRCPNTQAGLEVDAVGCPLSKDGDSDGVDDTKDRCPNTAPDTRVDAQGCPILFTEARTPVVLRGVTFETGRSALRPESYAVLDEVAASLVANPEIRIEIAGHTDNTGSEAANRRLSQARADAVRAYLASKGVVPDRMVARGYGEGSPVATNATPEGRAMNRRVELRQIP
ncbi:MAG TPA: OmpA family protein, partial [Gemmatimonadales bacterium]|nr:OmpA family protein [Gemmatimonadales bacterium]